ncbi:MAG: uroporphyrinogen decarboxylase family protein [Chloroflexota bacterium]
MSLSSKERFRGICHFERPGDLMLITPYFHDFWTETLDEWVKQGAPPEIRRSRFRGEYFHLDHMRMLREIDLGMFMDKTIDVGGMQYVYGIPPVVPRFDVEVVEEDQENIVLINEGGQRIRTSKKHPEKMPMYLDFPVKDRATWEEYKKRLEPWTPARWPGDWDAYVRRINSKEEPVMLNVGGLFGYIREWMGVEPLLYMVYDDPVLVEDMMEHMTYLQTEVVSKVLADVRVDCAMYWEDMCFKTGPLISPKMFQKFMVPRYRKVTQLLRSAGVDSIFVDSDGNLSQLIPLWLEAGINGFWPLEVAAGNDAVALRKKYGKDILLAGNIDKRAFLKDRNVLHEEIMAKVPFLLESGGYFPSLDHLVPPDVPFDMYRYFINTLRDVAGMGEISW